MSCSRPLLILAALAALSAPAAAFARPAIPPEFRGLWDSNACRTSNEDLQLTLSAHRVAFYEAEGRVLSVRRQGLRGIRVTVNISDEGMLQPMTFTFRLSADGHTLTNTTTRPWDDKTLCHR